MILYAANRIAWVLLLATLAAGIRYVVIDRGFNAWASVATAKLEQLGR